MEQAQWKASKMMRGLEHITCKKRLRVQGFFNCKKRSLSEIFIVVCISLMGEYGEDGATLLSEVHRGRRRGSGEWGIPTQCEGKKYCLLWEWLKTGTGCWEAVEFLCFVRSSTGQDWATYCSWHSCAQVVGLVDLWRSLPTYTTHEFCSLVIWWGKRQTVLKFQLFRGADFSDLHLCFVSSILWNCSANGQAILFSKQICKI